MPNLLIHTDNLQSLHFLLNERNLRGKVDWVYIDPPYATGGNFTITNGRVSTISNSNNGKVAYSDSLKGKDFIEFLRERLILLRELLSEYGSIYLHIDYKIGHYVKVMMDEVFGYRNIKDMSLFYTKSANPIWNEPREKYTEKDFEQLFSKTDKQGRRYTTVPIHAPGETENGKSNQPFKGILPPVGRHWRTDVQTLIQ